MEVWDVKANVKSIERSHTEENVMYSDSPRRLQEERKDISPQKSVDDDIFQL